MIQLVYHVSASLTLTKEMKNMQYAESTRVSVSVLSRLEILEWELEYPRLT